MIIYSLEKCSSACTTCVPFSVCFMFAFVVSTIPQVVLKFTDQSAEFKFGIAELLLAEEWVIP